MPTLNWLNRPAAFDTASQIPYRLLDTVSTHKAARPEPNAVRPEPALGQFQDNLLIQGDNLEALKALLPFYRGRVKCIFIDPPYNTKSAFEHYDDNLEHAQWLTMMLPRLQLLRQLLSEDGSIWVTIDDNEGHYLKVLMDEVFFVYAKAKLSWSPNKLPRSDAQKQYYSNPDNDSRGSWNSAAYTCAKTADKRPNLYYPLVHPTTGEEVWPKRSRVWAYGKETHEEHIRNQMIYWGVNGKASLPRIKKFLEDSGDVVPRSVWQHDDAGHNQEAMLEGLAIFGQTRFGTPKPERLLQRVLHIATNTGDLVPDSFLGSGTTAAVAHKMGRRWIGIEMGDHAATHCLPRLHKVLDGEQGGISKAVNWKGGGGFRFARLGETVFTEGGLINPAVRFATLAAFVWQQETGAAYDTDALSQGGVAGTPLIGVYSSETNLTESATAYYLLFNGILGDKRPASGNVLTRDVLAALLQLHKVHTPQGAFAVVYGEACLVGQERLALAGIRFSQIPYELRVR